MKKRLFSWLLAVMLTIGMVQPQAFAAQTEETTQQEEATGTIGETEGLTDLLFYTGLSSQMQSSSFFGKADEAYPDRAVFDPSQTNYTITVSDTVVNQSTTFRMALASAQEGATAEVHYGSDGSSKKALKIAGTGTHTGTNWAKVITAPGKNEFTIVVIPKAVASPVDGDSTEPVSYHFTIYCVPSLSGLSAAADGKSVPFDKDFSAAVSSYNGKVGTGSTEAEITATPRYTDYTVSYNGVSSNKIDLTQTKDVEIMVSVGEGEDYHYSSYYLTFLPTDSFSMQIESTPAKAGKVLYDYAGKRLYPDKNGKYEGLLEGLDYTYVVTAYGYVAQSDTVSSANALNNGKLVINLAKAPESDMPDYTGDWTNFRGNDENMGVTNASTATISENASLKWAQKYGSGWSAAPTPPIILNGELYIASGKKVMRLDKETGDKLAESENLAGSLGYAMNPVTYGEGMIFIPIGNGQVQALRADTLESVWVSEKLKGQTLCPITYKNGYIYEGTWNGEAANGTYFALSVTDEDPAQTNEIKLCSWKLDHTGGFYWAGAYATDSYVIFGSDDGTNEGTYVQTAVLYSADPASGEILDTIEGIKGDIRSTVSYDEESNRIYFSTKGGWFYSVTVNADGTFDKSSIKYMETGGMSTGTPLVYKGRAYLGVSGTAQFDDNGQSYKIIDINTMTAIYSVPIPGYVQTSALLSNAYEEKNGKIYIYVTYNYTPGGIYCIEDSAGQTEAKAYDLFLPTDTLSNYCICSLVCDRDGTIYYKNDSCYLMAVENTKKDAVTPEKPDIPDIPEVHVTGISLNKAELIMKKNRTEKLTPTIAPENAENKNVTFESSDTSIATVDKDGNVTSVAEGSCVITVKAEDGGATASCQVTVTDLAAKKISMLENNKAILIGDTYQLQVKTTPVGNGDVLTYSSNNEEIATVNTDGIVTGVSEGIVKITAKTEKGKKAVCTIKVDRVIPVVTDVRAVKITKNVVTLSWNRVENADGYYVYQYIPAKGNKAEKYKKIRTINKTKRAEAATSVTIKSLKAATSYQYAVAAFDKRADESISTGVYSDKLTVLTLPNASAITTAKKKNGEFALGWKKVAGAAGYTVYTSEEKNGEYVELGTFEEEKNLKTTIAIPAAGNHFYKVRSYIMDGDKKLYSDYSKAKKVRIK